MAILEQLGGRPRQVAAADAQRTLALALGHQVCGPPDHLAQMGGGPTFGGRDGSRQVVVAEAGQGS